jgi:hypothetical protein
MTLQKTLTVLINNIILGLSIYGTSISLVYASESQYDWCDPRFCCPPGNLDAS